MKVYMIKGHNLTEPWLVPSGHDVILPQGAALIAAQPAGDPEDGPIVTVTAEQFWSAYRDAIAGYDRDSAFTTRPDSIASRMAQTLGLEPKP